MARSVVDSERHGVPVSQRMAHMRAVSVLAGRIQCADTEQDGTDRSTVPKQFQNIASFTWKQAAGSETASAGASLDYGTRSAAIASRTAPQIVHGSRSWQPLPHRARPAAPLTIAVMHNSQHWNHPFLRPARRSRTRPTAISKKRKAFICANPVPRSKCQYC
jgi:hypothetical protein